MAEIGDILERFAYSAREKQCAALVGRASCLAVFDPREKQNIALTSEVGKTAGNMPDASPPSQAAPVSLESRRSVPPAAVSKASINPENSSEKQASYESSDGSLIPVTPFQVGASAQVSGGASAPPVTLVEYPVVPKGGSTRASHASPASSTIRAPLEPLGDRQSTAPNSTPNGSPVQQSGAQYDEESRKLEAIACALWNGERARKQPELTFRTSLFSRFRADGFEAPEQLPGTVLVRLSKSAQSSRACVLPRSYVLNAKDRASADSYYAFHGNGDEIVKIIQVAIHISEGGFSDILRGSIKMG